MHFTAMVKDELCKKNATRQSASLAQIYGSFLFAQVFSETRIELTLSHLPTVDLLHSMVRRRLKIDLMRTERGDGKVTLSAKNVADTALLRTAFGYDPSFAALSLRLSTALIENPADVPYFWRGAFLASGLLQDPTKSYRLEIRTSHHPLVRDLTVSLREFEFPFLLSRRKGHPVLYLRASKGIEDFLTFIGAPSAALFLMETKIDKDIRNLANRLVNCDTANVSRTINTAERRVAAFSALKASAAWALLSPALRQTADCQLEHPEESMQELAERLGVTKSCLAHRMCKLEGMNRELENR